MSDASSAAPQARRLSVGQWLVLLVVALFIGPLAVSNLWGYLQSRKYLTDSAFRNTRDLAALQAAETSDFMREVAASLPGLAAGDDRIAVMLGTLAAGDTAAPHTLHDVLRTAAAGSLEIDELQLISPAGVLLASSRAVDPAAAELTAALCYQRGRGATAVIAFSPGAGVEPTLVVARPIVSTETASGATAAPAGGRLIGVFCARLSFEVYRRLLRSLQSRGSGTDLFLVDDQQHLLASVEGGAVRAGGGRLPWLPRPPARVAWNARARSPAGDELIVAYAPVPGRDWGVVVAVPVASALADLEQLKWQALLLSAALMAVAALALVLAWRTMVRPLRALAGTSERIAGGAIGATVAPTGPREIAELATAFNRMSLALRDSQQTLEDRIASRTRALRDSEEFLELLLNSIDQRVVVTDRQHRIVKSNAAADRMHGRRLVDQICYQVFEGRDQPCDGCPVQRTFETGLPATAERSQHTVGGLEPVSIETYPVQVTGAPVESVIAISRVVSHEKHVQARMAFHEKMVAFGQLAAGVAHELGNPLAAIDSQLQRAEGDPARARETVGVVRKEVGRMARLLRELVDFSRRKRDEVRLASPNQVAEDVLRLLEHDPRARNVEQIRDLAPDPPGVRLVEDHLVQVLLNLGLNALDAMAGGGTLTLSTRAVPGSVEIRISDSGTGIAPEVRPRLFEAFYTTKTGGRGTGLGLFVSKRIVEDLGGALTLETTGPTGTTFLVRVPTPAPQGGRS